MTFNAKTAQTTKTSIPNVLSTLFDMLSWSRPHDSQTEARWIKTFITPTVPNFDAFGNRWTKIGTNSQILWSCHMDTVSSYEGVQDLAITKSGILSLAKPKAGHCLGADDGAGAWLLLEMIAAKIPGTYVFHRGEERGGLGSDWIARHNPELLNGIDFAIAFDRRGKSDIITHQMIGRTASDETAWQISGLLNRAKPKYAFAYSPSDGGTFTDTMNYAHTIAECTNISVGYEREHGPTETLDTIHLTKLRSAILAADWTTLKPNRQPGDYDQTAEWPDDAWYAAKPTKFHQPDYALLQLVCEFPEAATELLAGEGYTAEDFEHYLSRNQSF